MSEKNESGPLNKPTLWKHLSSGLTMFKEISVNVPSTHLRCPDRGAYFNCWGNHASPTQGPGVRRFECQGLYDAANRYRRNFLSAQDTAGLGVYGVNGVCHQTANLFLYSFRENDQPRHRSGYVTPATNTFRLAPKLNKAAASVPKPAVASLSPTAPDVSPRKP